MKIHRHLPAPIVLRHQKTGAQVDRVLVSLGGVESVLPAAIPLAKDLSSAQASLEVEPVDEALCTILDLPPLLVLDKTQIETLYRTGALALPSDRLLRVVEPPKVLGWAQAPAVLQLGEVVDIHPRGNSMRPRIESGARVRLRPASVRTVAVGDVVLCKVNGKLLLHKVGGKIADQVRIENERGRLNGWTRQVYGRVVAVDGSPVRSA